MKLEAFIIANAGKTIERGCFLYDQVNISIRCYGPGVYEAVLCYPAPYFMYRDVFDIRKMDSKEGELTRLYNWIQNTLLPNAEEAFKKMIMKS